MPDYLCGLDLGQSGDYTALSILRRSMALMADGRPKRSLAGYLLYKFECVHLQRFPLGTSYPVIVNETKALVERPELHGTPKLAIDATGVGRAVVDLFLNERMNATLLPITITAGDNPRSDRWNYSNAIGHWVPKNELVSSIRANLESGRLLIARRLKEAETLKKELMEFKVKITKAANETFNAREGAHDDLVLATAMPVWVGEQRWCHYEPPAIATIGPNTREGAALVDELKREAAALQMEKEKEDAEAERKHRDINNSLWWDGGGR